MRSALFLILSLIAGFALTRDTILIWDTGWQIDLSHWLIAKYSGAEAIIRDEQSKWYGPLWELVLGILSNSVFANLKDEHHVRHALTLALYLSSLGATYALLRRAKISQETSLLAVALLTGYIRLGGHALFNTKDVPFACAFLLATLYLASAKSLTRMSVAAVVPYFLRPPVLLHLPVLVVLLIRKNPRAVLVPLLALAAGVALWPAVWEKGLSGWLESFQLFSAYPLHLQVRAWGITFDSTEFQWWYPLGWILVAIQPIALLAAITGIIGLTRAKLQAPARWLLAFSVLAWASIYLARPTLYDEDRHLLFLYPPLLVLAALGFENFKKPALTRAITGIVLAGSLYSFLSWGIFSYVYKSPLIGDTRSERFMGDYWGVCVSEGMKALQTRAPANSVVVVDGPIEAAFLQAQRLNAGPYQLAPQIPAPETGISEYWVLQFNRLGSNQRILDDILTGRAQPQWTLNMPSGEPACVLAKYVR